MTLTEMILARASQRQSVKPGDIIIIEPDVVLSHDNSAAIATIFSQLPQRRVKYPERLAITLDHAVPPPTAKHAQNHARIREFVREQGISNFYEIGRGICHQVLCEEGVIGPGMTLLGADSHSPHFGWLGAFSAGIGRSEVAALWATGQLWLRVPESMRVTLNGKLNRGVTTKDLTISLIGRLSADGASYMAVEFERRWNRILIAGFTRSAHQYDGGDGRQERLHGARCGHLALAAGHAGANTPP